MRPAAPWGRRAFFVLARWRALSRQAAPTGATIPLSTVPRRARALSSPPSTARGEWARRTSAGCSPRCTRNAEHCPAHVQQPTAVPLPERVATLIRRASHGSRSGGDLPGEASSPYQRNSALFLGSIMAGLIVLAAVLAIVVRHQPGVHQEELDPPIGSATSAEPSGSDNDALRPSLVPAWQDGVTEQIRNVREATDEFERRAGRLWDDDTHSVPSDNPTSTIRPSIQEVTK
jgi:hypothetical protein